MKRKIQFGLVSVLMLAGCSGSAPDLGVREGRLKPCPETPNCVNSQADDREHAIEPIVVAKTVQETRNRLLETIRSEKRAEVVASEEHYIHALFRSAVFGFVDDVEFYIPEQQGTETVVHVRSASRLGRSDLGVNRKRIERIRNRMLE